MNLIINPGSRVPDGAENTYEQALAEARRWHERMRGEGFGDDLDLIEPDPAECRDGRWIFTFEHRVTGVTAELETHGVDPATDPFLRQYWQGSSSASPDLSDWAAPGYVQTFRPVERTRYESHQWNPTENSSECVACGVTWEDCDSGCPGGAA